MHGINLISVICAGINCIMGELRLYNGSVASEGMLQQCNSSNQWSAVCSLWWDCDDSEVACRQLGFDVLGESI